MLREAAAVAFQELGCDVTLIEDGLHVRHGSGEALVVLEQDVERALAQTGALTGGWAVVLASGASEALAGCPFLHGRLFASPIHRVLAATMEALRRPARAESPSACEIRCVFAPNIARRVGALRHRLLKDWDSGPFLRTLRGAGTKGDLAVLHAILGKELRGLESRHPACPFLKGKVSQYELLRGSLERTVEMLAAAGEEHESLASSLADLKTKLKDWGPS